jgi:hypothetical protein
MDQSGDYVVAWQSATQDGSGSGIYAQRLGVNNQTPTVGTLGDSPDPVISGNQVMLSASSVTDDVAATAVSFYRETNGLPGLQVGPEGDTLVGTALSPSGGIWTVNVSTTGLLAGPYTYWAQAYDAQGLTGAAASTVNTVNPPPGPAVASSNFLFQTAPQALAFTFDRDVSGSLSLVQGDLTVAKIGGGAVPAMTMLPYDHGTNTAGFTFNTLLADGNYEATLHASGITDPNSGMPMAGDVIFDFFMFAGDVNHDRKVDISDLQLLANNYNGTGKTFGQGDLNYDTLVNSIDLGILAARWQTSLSPPPPALPASLVPPIRRTPTRIVNTLA